MSDWFGCGGWTCCVEQGHYGHRARKATWLYARVPSPPPLNWGASEANIRLDHGFHSAAERKASIERMGKRERMGTPLAFRDLLLSIAATVAGPVLEAGR